MGTRDAERRWQPRDPILEHRPCGLRVGRGEEGEDVHVAVPEHVPSVRPAAQPARADRGLALFSDAGHQVKEREPHRQLQLGVPVDHHVGVLPPRGPSPPVLRK